MHRTVPCGGGPSSEVVRTHRPCPEIGSFGPPPSRCSTICCASPELAGPIRQLCSARLARLEGRSLRGPVKSGADAAGQPETLDGGARRSAVVQATPHLIRNRWRRRRCLRKAARRSGRFVSAERWFAATDVAASLLEFRYTNMFLVDIAMILSGIPRWLHFRPAFRSRRPQNLPPNTYGEGRSGTWGVQPAMVNQRSVCRSVAL